MFFSLSKTLGFLAQPSSVAALALLAGLFFMCRGARSRKAPALAWLGLSYILAAGLLPAGNIVLLPLEERFAGLTTPRPADGYEGIIILGGFEDGWVSSGRGLLAVNESAERLTEGLRLGLRLPATKVVFTGGVASLLSSGADAVEPVREFLLEAGIAAERIEVEGQSRNTEENARFTAQLLAPRASQRWLLVTSAYHMPRAMGVFRKAGFNVTAYPVDFRLRGSEDMARFFNRIPAGLQRTDLAVGEWLGLLAYYVTGRIDELLPGP